MNSGRDRLTCKASPAGDFAAARVLLFAALLACAGAEAAAQPQTPTPRPTPADAAPPPMRYLPAETRARLDTARDLKARTRLSMELAESSLVNAANLVNADRFDAATLELGVYQAIIRDAVDYVRRNSKSSGKTRDLFKRVELALRSHVPRLETLRRSLPSQHAVHAQTTLDFVRDARAEVLDAFFDNMVVPERASPKTQPPDDQRATGQPQPPQEKKPSDQR
jgi:hypothetical protein